MASVKKKKEDEEVKAVEPVPVPVTEKPKQEPLMYVGPTLAKYALIQNTVYSTLSDGGKRLAEEVPIARNLFVKVTDYWKAEKEIRTESGIIFSAFMAVLERR